ncbi:MAG: hypothetical protein K6E88_09335, partial [Lachnospiraceae bacterium]|nr:hypothetical protein [Lachnospiraceae bacterium]
YAVVLGIMFNLLVEVSGSLWSSVIAHASINTCNIILLLLANRLYSMMGTDISQLAQESVNKDMLLSMMGYMVGSAVISLLLAAGVLIAIANNEGRKDKLKGMFIRRAGSETPALEPKEAVSFAETEEKIHLLTPSAWIAIGISLFVIFFLDLIIGKFT